MNILLCSDGFPYVVSALRKYLQNDDHHPFGHP